MFYLKLNLDVYKRQRNSNTLQSTEGRVANLFRLRIVICAVILAMAAKMCGVEMCDHIVIAGARKNAYFSFRENTGILQ